MKKSLFLVAFLTSISGYCQKYVNVGFSDSIKSYQIDKVDSIYFSNDDKTNFSTKVVDNNIIKYTTITCKRNGINGIDADFCGLNAIGDAENSIIDANVNNRYIILIEGIFEFVNPQTVENGGDFKYSRTGSQYAAFIGKDYVTYKGISPEKTLISCRLDSTSIYPVGLTAQNYQTAYLQSHSNIENITFIGGICRYTFHIEYANDKKLNFKNCTFIRETSGTVLGSGGGQNYNWNFEQCRFIGGTCLFAYHPYLNLTTNIKSSIYFTGCHFEGNNTYLVSLETHLYNRNDSIRFYGCTYNGYLKVNYGSYDNSHLINTLSEVHIDSNPIPVNFSDANSKAVGIRIKSKENLTESVIRFDQTSSAFHHLVGNVFEIEPEKTDWSATKQYGYEYKDDKSGDSGYAVGYTNVNGRLGILLGNCTDSTKILVISINNVDYAVTFDKDYSKYTDAEILSVINIAIDGIGVADLFNIERYIFPHFENMDFNIENNGTSKLIAGMGIVKSSNSSMRVATSIDTFIDGIVIDDLAIGQCGRIIKSGTIFSYTGDGIHRFYSDASGKTGTYLTISSIVPGKFVVGTANTHLRFVANGIVKIL